MRLAKQAGENNLFHWPLDTTAVANRRMHAYTHIPLHTCAKHTHTHVHTHTQTHTHTLTQGGSSSQASRGGRESTKSILEDVPVLWDEELYKSEYDLSNFMQSQTISNH